VEIIPSTLDAFLQHFCSLSDMKSSDWAQQQTLTPEGLAVHLTETVRHGVPYGVLYHCHQWPAVN